PHTPHTADQASPARGRDRLLRRPQNEHRAVRLRAGAIAPRLDPSVATFCARATQASQMYTFGPAINLATSLGGRSQNVHTVSRLRLLECQTRCHQVPPALLTICCTR